MATDGVQTTYRVQKGNEVETLAEKKLRKRLRDGDLSGLELVRREGESEWQPLCETALFRDEVPFRGDPRDAARLRMVRRFGGHLMGWAICVAIFGALGSWFPFWLLIWAVFVALHGLKVAPTALELHREGKLLKLRPAPPRAQAAASATQAEPEPETAADETPFVIKEARRVRELLAAKGGEHAARLLGQIDSLVKTLGELAAKEADLEQLTSAAEREEIERAQEDARRRLRIADSDGDRELLQRELDAAEERQSALGDAVRMKERLRARRSTAEHQIKQLRLELSREEAQAVLLPDLTSRLEEIRIEAEAQEEVEEALALGARERSAKR